MCTSDEEHRNRPGEEYVVKYAQGPTGAAALISEVTSHALLEAGGVAHLTAAIVLVSDRLSQSYEGTAVGYRVEPGHHFGTCHRLDVYPAPPASYEELADPAELVDIWVFDSWLMNVDRATHGNMLMYHKSSSPRWSLLPADQSDCLCGACELQSGRYFRHCADRGPAETFDDLLDRTLLEYGPQVIRDSIDRVGNAVDELEHALDRVPAEWWHAAQVDRSALAECLRNRACGLLDIVNMEHWEGLANGINGGRLLDL